MATVERINSQELADLLMEELKCDLAEELSAVAQYLIYGAKVTGPYRPQLAAFFESEIQDELAHARFLADKIVALGGDPTVSVPAVPPADSNKEMLERVRDAERGAVRRYTERARRAEVAGDKGLQVQLEDMVRDETGHLEETERILREWPL